LATVAACADPEYKGPVLPAPALDFEAIGERAPIPVRVFIQLRQDDIDEPLARDSIDFWAVLGLQPEFGYSYEDADLRLLSSPADKVGPNGGCEAGRGWEDSGKVELYPRCIERMYGNYGEEVVYAATVDVLAHEIAHARRKAKHVPSKCDGSDPVNPIVVAADDTPICGEGAVLNPRNRVIHSGISMLDVLAFDAAGAQ
jgi:hypothetical protein